MSCGPVLRLVLLTVALIFLLSGCTDGSAQLTTAENSMAQPSPELLAAQGYVKPEIPRISAGRLNEMLLKDEKFVLVDTRFGYFYDLGHIPGAINLTPDGSNAELMALPLEAPIVFYCD